MFTFILEKIISGLLTLFGVATVVFFLFNVLPGDPAQMVLDQNATEVQLMKVKKKVRLRYAHWKAIFNLLE